MALQFPSNPADVGNVYEAPNGVIYYYDGYKWSGHTAPSNISLSEVAQDAAAAMITAGTNSGIIATYHDSTNSMDLALQLPTATNTILGGIKVGNNLEITDGVLSAIGGGDLLLSTPAGDSNPPAVLDQSKHVFVLGTGTWQLTNGTEGKLCYFVMHTTGSAISSIVNIDNIRVKVGEVATVLTSAVWRPFDNVAGSAADAATTVTAIFTQGAWNVNQGLVNP